jgi:signal transduction histidine kinase
MLAGTAASSGADRDAALGQRDAQVTAYAVDYLYRNWPGTMLSLLLAAIVMGSLMWQRISHWITVSWVLAVTIPIFVNYWLIKGYRNRPLAQRDVRRTVNHFTLTLIFIGTMWGLTNVIFFVPDSVFLQLFVLVCTAGFVAGSAAVLSYWLPAFYANALPATVLSVGYMMSKGTAAYVGIGLISLLYFFVINLVARNQNRMAREAISLRFENVELIEQLRLQKELAEQANVAKSKFLAAASHDLRQPLHALGLFVAALSEPSARQDAPSIVRNINRSLEALEGLFNALLDISKLDAGSVKPEIRDVSLSPLLDRLSYDYEPQARAKHLGWRYQPQDTVVRTDIVLLETVLRNLIGNAIRYTSRGEVWLDCAIDGDTVAIEVGDTGVGIPPAHHKEVFREFFQLGNPERDRNKGLGLGLAIVKRLTVLLGHSLEMHSMPEVGSVFRLSLSRGDEALVLATEPARDAAHSDDMPLRVLLIEDELNVQEAMSVLLQSWGHEVVPVSSEDEALTVAPMPDVVIADYRLRENRTGIEALRRIGDLWGQTIPSLVVTGDTSPERSLQAQENGFAFLHKPVAPGKLRAFLRGVQRARRTPVA